MKYTILHLIIDHNVGGVTTSVNSQIQSYLGDKFNFVLCSPTELLAQSKSLKPDLIIVNDACAWKFLPTLLQLRWLGKLIIQEHHYSADFETYKVPIKWRFRLMLRLAYKLASQVIAVSDAQGKWMGSSGFMGLTVYKDAIYTPLTRLKAILYKGLVFYKYSLSA